jgi:hypothetical protein
MLKEHSRLLRGMVATGAACALAWGVAASPASAAASRNSPFSHADGEACIGAGDANGRFEHRGDWFKVADMCHLDDPVHGAVILGDTKGNSSPEVVVWDTDGGNSGSYAGKQVNVKEGKRVNIRVCVGDKEEDAYWGCGKWEHGYG